MRSAHECFIVSVIVCFSLCIPCALAQTQVLASGTAPFVFDGNRVYAELSFVRPDGRLRKVLAFVDLGSPTTLLSDALYKELQLDQKKTLTFKFGEMSVSVDPSTVTSDTWLPFPIGETGKVEALLPAGILQKYQVVLDYSHRTLTLAQPGTLKPAGAPVPFRINEKTGLISLDIAINGRSYPITLDNGSAYTWLRKSTAQEWLGTHPDWLRGVGAVGPSNMRMADDGIEAAGEVIRIPEIRIGTAVVKQVGALAIGPSKTNWDFMDWYSQKNSAPVIGWLGGNVLRGFCITIDYPNRVTYWLPQRELDAHDLDQVGLTLESRNREFFVAAIVTQNGKPTVDGVQVGDQLLKIDALQTSAATWGAIFSAMHGKPGDIRALLLERAGKVFTVQAKVTAF